MKQDDIKIEVVSPSVELVDPPMATDVYERIEQMGRISYQSHDKIAPGSAEKFVRMIIKRGHLSLLEHVSLSAIFECSRAVADEIRTHRHTSPIMSSTRWCDYTKEKFGKTMKFVQYPPAETAEETAYWAKTYEDAVANYYGLREHGTPAEVARDALPLGLCAQFGVTANLREWKYILALRTEDSCHPQMRYLMNSLLEQMKEYYPAVFEQEERE